MGSFQPVPVSRKYGRLKLPFEIPHVKLLQDFNEVWIKIWLEVVEQVVLYQSKPLIQTLRDITNKSTCYSVQINEGSSLFFLVIKLSIIQFTKTETNVCIHFITHSFISNLFSLKFMLVFGSMEQLSGTKQKAKKQKQKMKTKQQLDQQ